MKKSELEKLIREAIEANMPAEKVQGTINLNLFKQLNPNINPSALSTAVTKVKNGTSLGMNDNKILAELMASLIRPSDDALLNKIFSNLKQIQSK
jgi:hypothetical protein